MSCPIPAVVYPQIGLGENSNSYQMISCMSFIYSEKYCNTRLKVRRLWAKDPGYSKLVSDKNIYLHRSTRLAAPRASGGSNYINATQVFSWKADAYGWATKTKLRLMARRGQQRENVDFGGLFAGIVGISNVRFWRPCGAN